ncbi:MAG: hypothetical protein KA535_02405 [Azonexus sp.]|nr:hypothetical protein [Azonexus sp.]
MFEHFKRFASAVNRSGLIGSLKSAMELEEQRYKGTFHRTDLSCIEIYLRRDAIEGGYHIAAHAKCSDLERTGFSDSDHPRIYCSGRFDTIDGAFGFLTEQVEQAKRLFVDSKFLYYPEESMPFGNAARVCQYDSVNKAWLPYEILFFQCGKCGSKVSGDELQGFSRTSAIRCGECDGKLIFMGSTRN